jgi:hypothetical protein
VNFHHFPQHEWSVILVFCGPQVANALLDARLPKRPLYIAHEVNPETEQLIRQRQIDYLLSQDLDQLVLQLAEVLLEVKAVAGVTNLTRLLPIRVFTPLHFP